MNRRNAIKYFVLISGGLAFLPSCKNNNETVSAYDHLQIDEADQTFLSEVSETILPQSATPGAKETGAPLFALAILNDCYKQEDREKFMKGLHSFQDEAKKKYNKSFADASPAQKASFFSSVAEEKDTDAGYFANTLKHLTIQGYTGSKYFLTDVQPYKLVPGKYKASVPA